MLDLRTFVRRAAEANRRASESGAPVQDVLRDMAIEEADKERRKKEQEAENLNALLNNIGKITDVR